jgi:amino acid transporter
LLPSFRAVLAVSVLFNVATLVLCVVGIFILRKKQKHSDVTAIIKMVVILSCILLGLVLRCVFWFSDVSFPRLFANGPGMSGWDFFLHAVVADAIILSAMVVFAFLGVYALYVRTKSRSNKSLEQSLLNDESRVPEIYQL